MKLTVCALLFALTIPAHAAETKTVETKTMDCKSEEAFPLISKTDLKAVAGKPDAFIVDVNSDESFKKNHVPGAIHFGSHKKDFTNLLPKDKNTLIVAYCGGPACTAWHKAAQIACEKGYTNVKHFKEGISGWTKD